MNPNTLELIFASNNDYKALEIQAAIGNIITIITLKKAGITINIPEPYNTLEANASEKSNTIFMLTGKNCFSEDTGLEVNALNGEPGVLSARYCEGDKLFSNNIDKLLYNLENITDRTARFRTVVSLRILNREFLFEGICNGTIAYRPLGTNGFGYDQVFIPPGGDRTFGQMSLEEKGILSHRKQAIDKMVVFLQQLHADRQKRV